MKRSLWLKQKQNLKEIRTLASRDDVKLTDPFNFTAPNFIPAAGSPATNWCELYGNG